MRSALRRSLVIALSLGAAACGAGSSGAGAGPTTSTSSHHVGGDLAAPDSTPSTSTTLPDLGAVPTADVEALRVLVGATMPLRRYASGTDRLGVWVCHVAVGVRDPMYNPVDFRLPLEPGKVASLLQKYVTPYFEKLSHGTYHPKFVAAGSVKIGTTQTNQDCVSRAQAKSAGDIAGLVVVADAEHAADQPGGWGRPGTPCPATGPCSAKITGRATYIGASDFHPDWGAEPAVDLEEHEIGHSLGLPHSGDGDGHTSGLDIMSNSAAPRDVDPARRDGPDTIGVDRLALGWLPLTDVLGPPDSGSGTVSLAASSATAGPRLLILPVDRSRFLTVEVLDNTGFNTHLPHAGVVVHLIDQSGPACHRSAAELCLNEYRSQVPLSSTRPFTDLLATGTSWAGHGWSVEVGPSHGGMWDLTVTKERS